MGEQRSVKGGRPTGVRALWAVLLVLAMLAFTWQSFVTQTHRHPGPASFGLAVKAGGAEAQKSGQAPSDSPADCPICQEIAHGGAYLAAAPILLDTPATIAAWFTVPLPLALALRQHSHGWRSRAPPLRFQA